MAHAQSTEDAEKLARAGLKDARKGKFDAAREKFEQAVKLDPQALYMHNLARALQKLDELPQAYRWFSQALTTDSEYKFASDARKHLKTIEKKLKKTHSRVRVQSTPSDVTCSVATADGKTESLIQTPFERWVPAGKLTISGRKTQYLDGKTEVTVQAGEDKTVKIRLEPQPLEGFVSVLADAPGAKVYLNGKELGPAPVNSHVVTSGTYTVEVRAKGYKPFKKTIVVEPDTTERVAARMELLGGTPTNPGSEPDLVPGYALIGTGSAVLVGGIVLVAVAFSKVPEINKYPKGDPAGDDLEDEANLINAIGWAALGTGAVLAGVGIYLLLSEQSAAESADATPTVIPTFNVGDEGAAAGALVRF